MTQRDAWQDEKDREAAETFRNHVHNLSRQWRAARGDARKARAALTVARKKKQRLRLDVINGIHFDSLRPGKADALLFASFIDTLSRGVEEAENAEARAKEQVKLLEARVETLYEQIQRVTSTFLNPLRRMQPGSGANGTRPEVEETRPDGSRVL